MKIEKLITGFISFWLLFGLVNGAKATVTSVESGYEVRYEISMDPPTSNGSPITNTFIFEWDDSNYSNFNVDYAYTIADHGTSTISHTIDFSPTSALLIGYAEGIEGIGDEKDHIYTITNTTFADSTLGMKWSAAFPGVTPETRFRHSEMVSLLQTLDVSALTNFVKTEGYRAAFDPAGDFSVVEWTCNGGVCPPPVPVPAAAWLFGSGLLGLVGIARRKKA
jgi:hypothetical protein